MWPIQRNDPDESEPKLRSNRCNNNDDNNNSNDDKDINRFITENSIFLITIRINILKLRIMIKIVMNN